MASQGIWFGSFLAFGLILQVSKGGLVGYHLITNGGHLYPAPHQQKTTQSELGLLEGFSTTDSSKKFNLTSTATGRFISKLIPGQEGYTGQNAEYKTSHWNQNQYKNRTTTEPPLGEFDRLNTTGVPGDFEPVTKYTGSLINKSVLGQDINDVNNQGYEVNDGERVIQKHLPLNQHQTLTTAEPQFGALDRINTTNVSEVFQPVTNFQSQNRTTTELQLEIVEKINITDAFKEFDSSSNIQAQNETATGPQSGVLDKLSTTEVEPETTNHTQTRTKTASHLVVFDRIITNNVSKVFVSETNNQPQNLTITEPQLGVFDKVNTTDLYEESEPAEKHQVQKLTTTKPQLEVFDKTNITDIIEEFEPETNNEAQNRTSTDPQIGVFERINTTDVSNEFEPAKNNQYQNRTPNKLQLGDFDKINSTDVYEEFQPETNNQAQNRTITELLLGVFERIISTYVSEEFDPARNIQAQNRTATAVHLGVYDILNTTDVTDESEPEANNDTQRRIITEPQLVVFDKINTTDVPKEFESVRSYKGVVSNKPVHGQEMYNDITAKGHAISSSDIVSDTSLLQNQTKNRITTDPRHGAFDTVNATGVVPGALEPISNSTRVVINQSVSEQEINNATARFGNGRLGELVKQGVTNLQVVDSQRADNQVKQMNGSVTTRKPLAMKQNESKGKVQTQSFNRQKIGKEGAQPRNSKKRGQQKGHTFMKAGKVNRNSSPKPRAQNRNNTRLGTLDRANATNITDEFQPVANLTGVVINQLVPGQELPKETLISGNIIMNQTFRYTSLSPNQTQNGTTAESRLGVLDRINTTNIPEELEPVTNSTGVTINESIPGQQMQYDTLLSGHTIMDRENISDTSLSQNQTQNRTTTEPRLGIFDKVNTTHDPDGSEPVTNFTSVVVDQLVPGQEIHNATLRSATDNGSRLIDQGVTKQVPKRGVKKTERNVKMVNNLTTKGKDSKGQLQLHSSVRKKQGNEQVKATNKRKQGNGTISRLIKQGITKSQAFESGAKKAEAKVRIVNILSTKGKDSDGQVQLHSVISKEQGNEQAKAKTGRKQGDTVINPNEVSRNYLSTTRPQHLTTIETTTHRAFERVNASDVTDELKLATNSSDVVMIQPVPGQEMNREAFISAQTTGIHQNVSDTSLSQNQIQNRTTKESNFGPFYRVNTTDDMEELELVANSTGVGINELGSEQIRKDALLSAQIITIRENASDAYLSQNQTQHLTTKESSLGPIFKVNTPDDVENFESIANSTEVGINESLSGRQIRKDALFSAHTISIRENDSDTSLTQKKTQNQTTKDSHLGTFYRVNTTDEIKELESVANSTGVGINEPLSGQQIRKDALLSGHTIINPEKISDTSVSPNPTQNRTTKEPRFEAFDRVNTTNAHEVLEPVTNVSAVVSKQPIPGQERNNATLKSGNEDMGTLTTQRVTTLQAAESGAPPANESVRILNTLVIKEKDSNGQVKLHTTIKKKQGNKPTKTRNSKKQGGRKGTDDKRGKN